MERAAKKAAEEWRGKRSRKSTTDLEQQRRCLQGPEQGSTRSKHPGDVLQRPAAPPEPSSTGRCDTLGAEATAEEMLSQGPLVARL